jgi:hypothetical protein
MTPQITLFVLRRWINSCHTIEQIDTCVRFARKVLDGECLKMAEQSARIREGELTLKMIAA